MADDKTASNEPDARDEEEFDPAAIENIPPADSNEQLRIAHEKREAAFNETVSEAASERKKAAAKDSDAHARTPQGRSTKPVTKA